MTDEIVVLAVTKMLSGMCIGGISLSTGEWVRPIKEFGTILPGDLAYADGAPIRPFDVVEFALAKHRPKAPHIEDWVCDYVRERPVLVRRLEEPEREVFLQKHAEPGGCEEIANQKRSLCLLNSQEAQALFSLDSYSSKYEARLYFPALGQQRAVPVTDIKWRALGRRLIGEGGRVQLSVEQLREITGAQSFYPAIGLSRQYEGKFWPLIVGVHCLPDYEVEIDYGAL